MTEFSQQKFEENSLLKFLGVCNRISDKHAAHKSKFVKVLENVDCKYLDTKIYIEEKLKKKT